MPYYKSQFTNSLLPQIYSVDGVTQNSGFVAMDSTEMTSFKARPRRDAVSTVEVSSLSADPYAYFLDSTSRKKYHDRLTERGLQPQGDPDKGHAFELKKHTLIGPRFNVTKTSNSSPFTAQFFRNCMVYPIPGGIASSAVDGIHAGGLTGPAPYKETGLDAFAQQAYSRVAPTAVVFDAALFLGELREGLPRLIPSVLTDGIKVYKNLGKDYLNVEFGWKPFIADLQNAVKALLGATDLLAEQGKRVHRRYSLPPLQQAASVSDSEIASIALANGRGFATQDNSLGASFGVGTSSGLATTYDYTKTRRSERWFEGEFSLFYPLGFDPNDYVSRLSVLLNPKITPSTLWELAPWSWLIDWNLRIGDTIRANEINANNLLIMHYGYAMEHTVYATALSWKTNSKPVSGFFLTGAPRGAYYQSHTVYKRRIRANPYGFRVGGTGSLTGGQTAILGALGLTKLK